MLGLAKYYTGCAIITYSLVTSVLGITCGVGLTVMTTTLDGPAAHPVGLIGTIV